VKPDAELLVQLTGAAEGNARRKLATQREITPKVQDQMNKKQGLGGRASRYEN